MKKTIAILMTMVLTCILFAGCNSGAAASSAPASVSAETSSVAQSDAYGTTLEDIKANGKLIVGLDDTFAPMGFRADWFRYRSCQSCL